MLNITPAPTPTSLGSHVVGELRRMIITGELPRGAHLVESHLSAQFGVSRGPIRDALRVLDAESLIETRRSGAYVLGLALGDLEELYAIRELLELEALRSLTTRGSDSWVPVEEALAQMAAAARSNDVTALARADLDFHTAFYRLAGNRRLESIWGQYREQFAVLLELSNAEAQGDLPTTHRDHAELLECVRAGDIEVIEKQFRAHVAESLRRMRAFHARKHLVEGPS